VNDTPTTATAAADEKLDRPTRIALLAMGLAVLIIANDFTALSVALPSIESDLDSDLSTVQWVINAYGLVFGVMIVTGGRLADMFGRRRIFVAGAGIFAAFSLLGGVAQSDIWLIACRALMGIGGAMMWPAIVGMTYAVLPESKVGLAGGLILGAAGFGNAMGPLIGGALSDELSWRWIFFLNLPIAALGVFATLRAIKPDEPADRHQRIDYPGIATLSLGLVGVMLALDQSSDWGWSDPRVIAFMAVGALLVVAFAVIERRTSEGALIPREVIGNANFRAACLTVLLMSAVFFAALLYLPQFMTKSLGYDALEAGAGLLPMMATFAIVSFIAGPLYGKLGTKTVVSAGAACCTVGIFLLSFMEAGDEYSSLLAGMFVLGAGIGLFYSSVTTAGVTALDPSQASLAGGIIYMFQVGGGVVGLAMNTAIVTSDSGDSVTRFVDGIGDAFLVDAILAACGLLVALLFVGGRVSAEMLRSFRPHLHRAHG
jgi:EmrB/QacA subfamily drug resistance transporter